MSRRLARALFQVALPLAVLAAFAFGARHLLQNRPAPERRPPPPPVAVDVDALRLQPQDYAVVIRSQGTVQPRTEGTLVAQLSGELVEISPNLREGAFFEKGEVLAVIDPRDYEIAVTVAEAELARARAALEEEKARAQLAAQELRQMDRAGRANPIALRKPQLAAAQATVAAADAQLAKARLSLERTRVRAPYAGRVLRQRVDLGQVVSQGAALAEIYAIDYAQIRLPLSDRQLAFVDLPERFRGDDDTADDGAGGAAGAELPVTVSAEIGRERYQWSGRIVRTEGAVDAASRQLFVIAQVDDPYRRGADGRPPLRVGQYVRGEIQGERLSGVYVVPRGALAEGEEALLIDEDGRLLRRRVDVLWRDERVAVLADRLRPGTLLALTPLPGVLSGTPVSATVADETPERLAERRGRGRERLPAGGEGGVRP